MPPPTSQGQVWPQARLSDFEVPGFKVCPLNAAVPEPGCGRPGAVPSLVPRPLHRAGYTCPWHHEMQTKVIVIQPQVLTNLSTNYYLRGKKVQMVFFFALGKDRMPMLCVHQ